MKLVPIAMAMEMLTQLLQEVLFRSAVDAQASVDALVLTCALQEVLFSVQGMEY